MARVGAKGRVMRQETSELGSRGIAGTVLSLPVNRTSHRSWWDAECGSSPVCSHSAERGGSEDGLKDSASPTPAGVGQASILIPGSERSLLLSGPTLGCGKSSTKPRPPGGGASFPVLMKSSAPGTEN